MGYIPKDARWYLADAIVEHIIEGDPRNVLHVNLVLVEAGSPEQAYEKAMAMGRAYEQNLVNTDGQNVSVIFRGLQDLNVIHDDLVDGAELAFSEEVSVSEDDIASRVRPREKLAVFRDSEPKHDLPNYFPQSVKRLLEEYICPDDELDLEE